MEKFKKKKKYNKGFTLTELLVTVSILSILTIVSVPQYVQYRQDAAIGALNSSLRNISSAWTSCISASSSSDNQASCKTWEGIGLNHYDKKAGEGQKSGKWTCFGLSHTVGRNSLKGCTAMSTDGKRQNSIGITDTEGEFLIDENKFCYCTHATEPAQLWSPIDKCDGPDDCETCTASGWTKECLQNEGVCQSSGQCK